MSSPAALDFGWAGELTGGRTRKQEETMGASYRELLIWFVVLTVLFLLFMVALELFSVD